MREEYELEVLEHYDIEVKEHPKDKGCVFFAIQMRERCC